MILTKNSHLKKIIFTKQIYYMIYFPKSFNIKCFKFVHSSEMEVSSAGSYPKICSQVIKD